MMEDIEKETTKERPKVLYHGSPNKDIEEFEPRGNSHRDEPPAVYATPEKYLATIYMHKSTGMVGFAGKSLVPYAVLFGPREEVMGLDQGGSLYVFSSDSFEPNPKGGHGEREWAAHVPVKPVSKEEFPSIIEEVMKEGMQVYVVDRNMYQPLHEALDEGTFNDILRAAESENQRRGVNVRHF
jgi:hypothetical protein